MSLIYYCNIDLTHHTSKYCSNTPGKSRAARPRGTQGMTLWQVYKPSVKQFEPAVINPLVIKLGDPKNMFAHQIFKHADLFKLTKSVKDNW